MTALIDELRPLPLFQGFSAEQLRWVADHATVVSLGAGERLFAEGEVGDAFWVLLDGEWELTRLVDGYETTMVTTGQPGTWGGGSTVADGRHPVGARTLRPSRFLRIPDADLRTMLSQGSPIALHLLDGLRVGTQAMARMTLQHEKLTALGKLAAGLAHELNNPAAAARRAAAELHGVLNDQRETLLALMPAEAVNHWQPELDRLRDEVVASAATKHPFDELERTDRLEAICSELEAHGITDSWDAASALVDVGLDLPWVERLAARFPEVELSAVVRWLGAAITGHLLADRLERTTARISELIAAIKSYSYMDQGPLQEVDIHEGLESTLTMLHHELKGGVEVVRDYDRDLPRITARGGELNQVWTNLIDNAIDAMDGRGRLTVRTAREGEHILVEIGDTGAGIPPEVQPRIFEPFFTTKGVGEGTGLGLDIAYRVVVTQHHGGIQIRSKPGETWFSVRLPVSPTAPGG